MMFFVFAWAKFGDNLSQADTQQDATVLAVPSGTGHADQQDDLEDPEVDRELAGLEADATKHQEVSGDVGVTKLQDALDTRNAQKRDAKAVGATCKASCKKPAANVQVLKRPSAKVKAKGKSKAKGQVNANAKDKGKKPAKKLKMSRECIYSRAYHQASHPLQSIFSKRKMLKT